MYEGIVFRNNIREFLYIIYNVAKIQQTEEAFFKSEVEK